MGIVRATLIISTTTVLAFPKPGRGQNDDLTQIQIAAVSHVLDFVKPFPRGPVVACVSTNSAKFIGGRTSPMGEGVDLDSAVISAIPKAKTPVRAGSSCYIDRAGRLERREVGTGRQAMTIVVGKPTFKEAGLAELVTEYWINGLNGMGFLCTLVRQASHWTIRSCKTTWES